MINQGSAWTEQSLRARQQQTAAPSWLQSWRDQQLTEFLQRGFPQRRDENWKYLPLADLLRENFIHHQANSSRIFDLADMAFDSYRLVFIDGIFSPLQSHELPQGIKIMTGIDAMRCYPENYPSASVFHYLNGALGAESLVLQIADNMTLPKPLHILYMTTDHNVMQHPRQLIQVGFNSQITILEEYRGFTASSYFNNVITQISLAAQARLNYYKLQCESSSAFHISNTRIVQAQDSLFQAYHFACGGKIYREDLSVALQHSGADSELTGFYYAKAAQNMDFHTRLDHLAGHTRSRQYYKGIVGGNGCGVFNGKIHVQPKAQQVSAEQKNHNLLLSATAEVNTKPELEVFADDVKCQHGATAGHLDLNALFYLRSRGIPEKLARHLLMCGFAGEILARLPEQPVAAYIRAQVLAQLAELDLAEFNEHVGLYE
jgi:Fe-S cluster assembly protein SufD